MARHALGLSLAAAATLSAALDGGEGPPPDPAWLTDYLAAKRGTSDAQIVALGHSLMTGAGNNTMVGLAGVAPTAYLAGLLADGARSGFYGDQGARRASTTMAIYDTRFVKGNWVTTAPGDFDYLGGDNWVSFNNSTTAANRLAFTPGVTFDRVTVYCSRYSGGPTLAVWVDGTQRGTVSLNNGGDAEPFSHTFSVPAGSVVSFSASAAGAYLSGVKCWSSTAKRTNIIPACLWGGETSEFVTDWAVSALTALDLLGGDLFLIMLDSNDMLVGIPPAEFQTNLGTLIDRCKAMGSVLVISDWLTPEASSGFSEAAQATWHNYAKAVAAAKSVGFLGLHEVLGTGAENKAAGYFASDDAHGSPLGYETIAGLIFDAIDY